MGVNVRITDELFGKSKLSIFELTYPSERLTIREIITRRVEEEILRVNYKNQIPERIKAEHRMFLAELTQTSPEVLLNADTKKKKLVNPVTAVSTALESFKAGGFFLLLNEKQYDSLDDKVILTPNSEVIFLRLTPLLGG